MQREMVLTPTATVSSWVNYVDPNTSRYPWLGTGSKALHEIWAGNGENATTPGLGTITPYAYCWPNGGTEHIVSFEPGPTLSLFTKVTLKTRFDYSQTGPNNWYGDSGTGFMVGLKFAIRNRAEDGWHYGTPCYIGDPNSPAGDLSGNPGDSYNVRPAEGDVFDLTPWYTQEWTSHPDGGPWTLEDINNLAAGVSFLWWGPNDDPQGSPAYDNSEGSFFKIRVPNFLCILTVEDLGGYIRNVRHNASATLRMKRKARNTINVTVPAHFATKEIGEQVHFAHRRGPDGGGAGWGDRPLERRSGWLAQRTYWPEALKIVDEAYDLHDFSCEMWGAFRIPIAWTPELNGFAYLDQGGEFTFSRAQDGWSLRPGDGAALRVLDGYPNLSEEGLAIHSQNGTELCLYNYDLGQTGWSTTDTAGGTITFSAEESVVMADELGYQTCRLMEFPGTPSTGGKKRTVSLSDGDTVSIRARVKNVSVSDPATKFLEVAFLDPDGKFWDEGSRTWQVEASYAEIPASAAFGEVVMDQIPVGVTGNHTIKVGRFSSAINSCTFAIGLVDVIQNDNGMGMPLVTLDQSIAREPDVLTFDNTSPFTFWHRDRGMAIIEFRPFWRADCLAPSTEKRIVFADHAAAAWDEVRFVAGATDQFVFERYDVAGGSRTVSVNVVDSNGDPLKLTRDYYVRLFVRWLDSDGWRDRPPYEAMIGYVVYDYSSDSIVSSYEEATDTWPAPDASAEDDVILSGLDGWLRWVEVKRNPLSGQEAVWRR